MAVLASWRAVLTLSVPADELVQAGWEKCWSKRENRPYYFNRFTNQSLWEMPVLGQHDVIVSKDLSLRAVLWGQWPWSVDSRWPLWEGLVCPLNPWPSPSSSWLWGNVPPSGTRSGCAVEVQCTAQRTLSLGMLCCNFLI